VTTPAADQVSVWPPDLVALRADTPATSERPNSPKHGPAGPPRTTSAHPAGAAQPTVDASPVARDSQEVSCLIACSDDP
jgi:hypothetical protein